MKEAKNDKFIGLLSISVFAIMVLVFVLTITTSHTKATYSAWDGDVIHYSECGENGKFLCETGRAYFLGMTGLTGSQLWCDECQKEGDCWVVTCYKNGSSSSPSTGGSAGSSTCPKTDRGSGCYVCGNVQSGTRQDYTVDPEKDVCDSKKGCTRISDTCESTATDETKTILLKNAEGTTGNGYFVVNKSNNKIIVFNPTKNCGTWSTKPCANADCNNGASAQDSAHSGLAVGVTYNGPAVLYCKAGTSGGGNVTPTDKPTSKTTSTPVDNSPTNPQTGVTGFVIAWIVGLSAIVYSLWYFKKNFNNN